MDCRSCMVGGVPRYTQSRTKGTLSREGFVFVVNFFFILLYWESYCSFSLSLFSPNCFFFFFHSRLFREGRQLSPFLGSQACIREVQKTVELILGCLVYNTFSQQREGKYPNTSRCIPLLFPSVKKKKNLSREFSQSQKKHHIHTESTKTCPPLPSLGYSPPQYNPNKQKKTNTEIPEKIVSPLLMPPYSAYCSSLPRSPAASSISVFVARDILSKPSVFQRDTNSVQ